MTRKLTPFEKHLSLDFDCYEDCKAFNRFKEEIMDTLKFPLDKDENGNEEDGLRQSKFSLTKELEPSDSKNFRKFMRLISRLIAKFKKARKKRMAEKPMKC